MTDWTPPFTDANAGAEYSPFNCDPLFFGLRRPLPIWDTCCFISASNLIRHALERDELELVRGAYAGKSEAMRLSIDFSDQLWFGQLWRHKFV